MTWRSRAPRSAAFGLTTAEERLTNTLSGGEQRRVAMASLLAQQSRVYVLDEPSNHLDPQVPDRRTGLVSRALRGG